MKRKERERKKRRRKGKTICFLFETEKQRFEGVSLSIYFSCSGYIGKVWNFWDILRPLAGICLASERYLDFADLLSSSTTTMTLPLLHLFQCIMAHSLVYVILSLADQAQRFQSAW